MWPERVVPPWSVPPGLIAPQVTGHGAERPEAAPADPEPPNDEGEFPGAAPPAGWFLGAAPTGPADSTPAADAGQDLTGEWFAAPAPERGESAISWSAGMDDPDPEPPAPAEPVVGPTRALRGRPGGPGLPPRRPVPGSRKAPVDRSPWQTSQRLWTESEIPWQPGSPQPSPLIPSPRSPYRAPQRPAAGRQVRPGPRSPEPVSAAWPGNMRVPLGAPVTAEPRSGASPEPRIEARRQPREDAWPEMRTAPRTEPHASVLTEPEDEPLDDYDTWRAPSAAPPLWDDEDNGSETLMLKPGLPGTWDRGTRRRRSRRRTAAIVVPVIVLVAVAVLALALLTGHGPKFGQLTSNQRANQANQGAQPNQGAAAQSALTIGIYPGQQQRGVFQTVNRIVASGDTIVTMGSQTSDGVVRQQFFASTNGGATWRLAPVHAAGGSKAQAPLGHPAARLAGGPGGWLAIGPQAIWTSPNGQSWTLASTAGITPMLTGDSMWVLNSMSDGFIAAGANHGTQAVIWTSRDGVTWQRKTAAQLGLAGPGETVQNISYVTARGTATVISGQVTNHGASYAGVWLSTNGGSTWTRVTVPADHGAGTAITGLGSDASGLLAVRPGQSANGTPDGIAYFSPNGTAWQYAGTIGATAGWNPGLVKGSDFGFVVAGTSAAGQLVAFTSTGTGGTWQQTGSLGNADTESVVGATVASAGTIVAVGYTSPSKVSQQPVFLMASATGSVRPVALVGTIPELSVNGLSVAAGQQIAVGSTEGYPAVWRRASGGSWALATSLSQVSGASGLEALTGVTHGLQGWLAVGAPGPVVMTSTDGATWRSATGPGSITADLAGVGAVAAAAGPHGYVIVGKLVAPGGSCVADVWWSPDLNVWNRAHDVNDVTGSSQVLAVAADAGGFVSVGSHNGQPAVWTTANGTTWTTIVLPVPAGASSAVLQQIAISGNRVAALGQAYTKTGAVPIAELSVNGGNSWQQVPFRSPGPDTTFTALTATSGGFTAAGQFGQPGQQQVAAWTSATGTSWQPASIGGLNGPRTGGSYQISALAPSGNAVTGIGSLATQASQAVFTVTLPAR